MPTRAFISNDGANQVHVFDLTNRREIDRLAVDPGPFGMALTPDQRQLWVPLDHARKVAIFDTQSLTKLREIALPDPNLVHVAITPDGQAAFCLSIHGVLYLLDVQDGSVATAWGIGGGDTERLAISPDGAELWVADEGRDALLIASTDGTRTVEERKLAGPPGEILFAPDGLSVYVTALMDDRVWVIDRQSREVKAQISLPVKNGLPRALAVVPDGSTVLVSLFAQDQVLVIDTVSHQVVGKVKGLFDGPSAIAVTPDGKTAVVVNEAGGRISLVDLHFQQEIASHWCHGSPRQVLIGTVPNSVGGKGERTRDRTKRERVEAHNPRPVGE
jgi:YVTN family beta-propeller protein